jgi:hypothetical protein
MQTHARFPCPNTRNAHRLGPVPSLRFGNAGLGGAPADADDRLVRQFPLPLLPGSVPAWCTHMECKNDNLLRTALTAIIGLV